MGRRRHFHRQLVAGPEVIQTWSRPGYTLPDKYSNRFVRQHRYPGARVFLLTLRRGVRAGRTYGHRGPWRANAWCVRGRVILEGSHSWRGLGVTTREVLMSGSS